MTIQPSLLTLITPEQAAYLYGPPPVFVDALLLEDDFFLLTEAGDKVLL